MDPPMQVIRSSSVSDVADLVEGAVRMSKTLPPSSVSDINSHPEDYVVLDGKPVRLKKPSSAYSMEKTDLGCLTNSQEIGTLHKDRSLRGRSTALEQENLNVNNSSKDLSRQARRIRELESFVPERVADDDAKTSLNSSYESGEETLESLRKASYMKRPSSGQKVVNNDKALSATPIATIATEELVPNAASTEEDLNSDNAESLLNIDVNNKRKKRGPPPSLAQRLALGSTERRRLNTTNNATTVLDESPIARYSESEKTPSFRFDPSVDSLRSATVGGDLNATNSTHAVSTVRRLKSDRALNRGLSTSPSGLVDNVFSPANTLTLNTTLSATTPAAHSTPLVLSLPTPTPVQNYKTTFFWKEQQALLAAQGKSDIFLFIAHDNPQMGKSVATQLSDSGINSVHSGSSAKYTNNSTATTNTTTTGMMCMLECKDQAKPPNVHFILGKIAYSGDYHHIEGFESTQSRGSGCIVVCELRAIKCDIKALTTRNKNDIIEVDLVNLPERAAVPLNTEQDLRAFLRPCTERVDVILDPIQSHYQWYPYWEGLRRMAPQFRSKGIGYLRLGDDMSQYGSAFLSLDAGVTYLDDGATSIVNNNNSSTPGFHSALGTPYTYNNNNSTMKGSGLRLSKSFSCATGVGLPGSLNNTYGSAGKFNYTYTPSSTTAATVTPIPDSSNNNNGGYDNIASSGVSSGLPRSPRAAAAGLNSTSKKLSFTSGPSTTSNNHTSTTRHNGTATAASANANGSADVMISPHGNAQSTGNLKRTNSNHQNVVADPQWDESLSHLRECLHILKTNDTMKWTERIEILQKLACIMQHIAGFPTLESFVYTHYSTLCEVFTLLTETISKHTNPNVLVCTASVVGTIVYGSLLVSSGSWLPWRGLILECVHTLRSTNKMVQEAMSECLIHLYSCGSITISTLCNGSLLSDIILGTKTGAVKKGSNAAGKVATAANTVKVIQWLDTVCNTDIDLLLTSYATTTTSITTATTTTANNNNSNNATNPTSEIPTMIKTLLVLLSHREETTREHTIVLLTTLFTWDVLFTQSQTGLSGLLLLSRKLSTEGVRKNSNATTGGEDADNKLKLFDEPLSPALLPLLAEIKTVSARSYDKIVSLLAQRVSKHALNCAVHSVSKVAETPTVVSPTALKRAGSGASIGTITYIGNSKQTSDGANVPSALPDVVISRTSSGSGTTSPRTGLANTIISPRLSFSRVGSANSGTSERTRNDMQSGAYVMNNSSSDLNLRIASNVSTPPQNYHLKDVTNTDNTTVHTNSTLLGHVTPVLTPRDNTIINNLTSGVVSLSNKDATIDQAKMQIGLQGIKAMRKGSFTNNSSRCSTANSTSNPRDSDNSTDNNTTETVDVPSRTNSASRLRRRITQTTNPDTSEPSLLNNTTITLNPLTINQGQGNRSRAASNDMYIPIHRAGSSSPKSLSPASATLSAKLNNNSHAGGVDVITPRGEHCAPMRSPVMRNNKSLHPAIAATANTNGSVDTHTASSNTVDIITPRGEHCAPMRSPVMRNNKSLHPAIATVSANLNVDLQTTLSTLDPMWYEAKLLLKQVPTTEAAWETLSQIIRKSHTFFASLNALSAHTGVPKGAILRHVLPFDENTSSNDQAKGRVSPHAGGSATSTVTSSPVALVGHEENLQILAHRAIELRGIIRVKMADEADVNQAATATTMLRKFIEQLDYASFTHSLTPLQVIARLESL